MVGGGALAVVGGLQAQHMCEYVLFYTLLAYTYINKAGNKISLAISIAVYALLAVLSVLG
jgi:hypothetical protein